MPPKQQWVRMVDPSGVAKDVHPADVAAASTPIEEGGRGYSVETPEQAKLREYQTKEGSSVSEALKATGEHAAGTLTFGGSDALLSQSPEYRERRQLRDESFPISGAVGTIGASLVPVAGQLSKIGALKAAGAPLAAVSRGSMALGSAVERTLAGAAPGVARRLGAKVAGGVVAGGAEGAAIGAGQALSESSIQNKDLTAELLLARMGEGASIGGVLGGALGGTGELFGLVGKGSKTALRYVPGVGDLVGQDAQALARAKALNALGFQRSNFNAAIKKLGPNAIDELGDEAIRILELDKKGAVGRALKYEMGEGTERVASVLESENAKLNDIYESIGSGGSVTPARTVASRVESEVLEPLRSSLSGGDDRAIAALKREMRPLTKAIEQAEKFTGAARAIPEVKNRLTGLGELAARGEYAELSAAARTMRSELEELRAHYRSLGMNEASNGVRKLSRSLRDVATGEGKNIYPRMSAVRDSFNLLDDSVSRAVQEHGAATIPTAKLWETTKKVAAQVKNFQITRDPKEAAFRQYWQILKDEMNTQAERAGLGPQLAETNQRLKRVIALNDVASKSAGFGGNRQVSLTDTIAGAGMAGAGSMLGGGLGAAAGGVIGGTVNRFMRSAAGDELMAIAANRFASLRKAVDTADTAAEGISKQVRDAISPAVIKQKTLGVATRLAGDFEGQRQLVIARNEEQDRLLAELNQRTAEAADVAPELTGAITSVAARGSQLLSSEMPQPIGTGDIRDRASLPDIPDSEKAAWLRKLGVVRNPTSVIDDMKKGQLTGEQVATLQKAYPELYRKMQTDLVQHLERNALEGKAPNYQQRAQASVFAQLPIDATFSPDMIRAFQKRYAQKPQPATPAPRRSLARAEGISRRRASPLDREVEV